MSAIKKFFEKKKLDYKFKKLGTGHSLNEPPQRDHQSKSPRPQSSAHQTTSDGAQRAAEAAIARASQPKPGSSAFAAQKSKIRQELEAENARCNSAQAAAPPVAQEFDSVPMCRVLYRCELMEESLPRSEIEGRIAQFLTDQLREDPLEAAALIIKTLNKNVEKVQTCIETIKKIIQNISSHPGEEKYLKIRANNKALKERVFDVRGARDFLLGAGFHPQTLPGPEGGDLEEFLVMEQGLSTDADALANFIEVLETAEPIVPVLDHDPRLFYPTNKVHAFHVPDEFYAISKEELKKEQQLRQEAVEKLGMLRTKAMRDRDEQRELRKYRFTAVRIRLPNGLILQGTFYARASFSSLLEFIRNNLVVEWLPFHVVAPAAGGRIPDDQAEKTLAELGLVPSSVVNAAFDEDIVTQYRQSVGSDFYFIKDDLLSNIERL